MNEYSIYLFCILFPGLLFSHLYLRDVPEYTKTLELKLISIHSIMAVVFGACYLVFCLAFSSLLNWKFTQTFIKVSVSFSEVKLLPILLLYLASFYIAFRLGNFLCKKKFLYPCFKTRGRWDVVFSQSERINYFISTVVETGGETWLYIGILDDYVTQRGELELIQIRRPYRRLVKGEEKDKNKNFCDKNGITKGLSKKYYRIDVDILSIRYIDIRSLGIRKVIVE